VLIVNVSAASKIGIRNNYKPVIDTIIKLDTAKDKKLLKIYVSMPGVPFKIKQSAGNKNVKTAKTDTSKRKTKDGLDSELKFSDDDSTITDNVHKILYLYGKARVKYQDVEMDADYIRVDQKKQSHIRQWKH